MKNFNFSRRAGLILTALFVIGFVFAGCKPETPVQTLPDGIVELSENDKLVGTWKASEYESYEITTTTFKSGYEGNNLVVGYTNKEKTAGYIYIKYTKAYESTSTEPTGDDKDTWTYVPAYHNEENPEWDSPESWYRYSTTAPDVGKWYAISFTDLSDNAIKISGAYGKKSSVATLEEAISEFTIENKYFGFYSACTK